MLIIQHFIYIFLSSIFKTKKNTKNILSNAPKTRLKSRRGFRVENDGDWSKILILGGDTALTSVGDDQMMTSSMVYNRSNMNFSLLRK